MPDKSATRVKMLVLDCFLDGLFVAFAVVISETGRFDTNPSNEIAQKFRSLQVKFAVEQEKHFG